MRTLVGMDDEKKNRWVKSLDEAGLLDEIEDGWALPDDLEQDATIRVEGKDEGGVAESLPPALESLASDSDVPFAVPILSLPPLAAEEEGLPEMPAGAEISIPTPDTADGQRELLSPDALNPFRKSSSPPLEGLLPTEDLSGIPISTKNLKAARSTLSFTEEDSQDEPADDVSDAESFAIAREARISVVPETPAPVVTQPQGAIWDEPPPLSRSSAEIHAAINESLASLEKPERISGDPLAMVEDLDEPEDVAVKMRDFYDIGDYSGALELAEKILEESPDDAEATKCRDASRDVLMQMYESRIGSLDRTPVPSIDAAEVIWRNLDPAAGFVLSRIDGVMTFEDILDISGLPRFETFRILSQLLQDGIIE